MNLTGALEAWTLSYWNGLMPSPLLRLVPRATLLRALAEERYYDSWFRNRAFRLTGYKPRIWDWAYLACRNHAKITKNVEAQLKAYELLEEFFEYKVPKIPLEQILKEASTADSQKIILEDFSFIPLIREKEGNIEIRWFNAIFENRCYRIVMGAALGLALCYQKKPIAYTTFFVQDKDTLTKVDLQGVKPDLLDENRRHIEYYDPAQGGCVFARGHTPKLHDFDWQCLMMRLLHEFARAKGYSRVIHRGPKNLPLQLSAEGAYKHYVAPAKRMNLEPTEDGNYLAVL